MRRSARTETRTPHTASSLLGTTEHAYAPNPLVPQPLGTYPLGANPIFSSPLAAASVAAVAAAIAHLTSPKEPAEARGDDGEDATKAASQPASVATQVYGALVSQLLSPRRSARTARGKE